ncbi:hypothetical protein F5H01DRAFT_344613 [Linnemannia elongata]|nr:hypothetical protein F5H01DRAFT_344613 [Linnemannia elongata]
MEIGRVWLFCNVVVIYFFVAEGRIEYAKKCTRQNVENARRVRRDIYVCVCVLDKSGERTKEKEKKGLRVEWSGV